MAAAAHTVTGLGILARTRFTSLQETRFGIAAAAVNILVPDNTGNADVLGAIGARAAAFGRAPIKSDSEI
jgi:hypothetical protein